MKFRIADLFCGAGGTSAGAVEALEHLGFEVELTAVNHWPTAIATHEKNHPGARHLCTGIDSVNPLDYFKRGELDMLWASPECTHHSIARGGRPINDQSRSTAWHVLNWAEKLEPSFILLENVPEWETWGPLDENNRPIPSLKGKIFRAMLSGYRALGYKLTHGLFCAADYGDPTTRTRLFVVMVRGNCRRIGKKLKLVLPSPTHSRSPDLLSPRRWTPAREIIDWSIEGQSIYERKRPLSPKTMARIEAGLRKFGLRNFIVPQFGERPGQDPRTHDLAHPAPAVTSHGAGALVQPFLVPQHSSNGPRSIDSPAPTVTTTSRGVGLVEPYIVSWDHTSGGPGAGVKPIDEPLSAIVTKARHGVAEPFILKLRGGTAAHIEASSGSVEQPLDTVTANGNHHALAEPFLVQVAHGASGGDESRVRSLEAPMPTVCGNRGDMALVEPCLLGQQQGAALRPVSEPAPTVATAGAIALVEPFLVSYYGTAKAQSADDPLDTVTTKDRHALVRPVVEIDGARYVLDIRFRMLQPHELALAQGFRRGYKFTGNKTDQVKQIGNAVPRRLARALVAAIVSQNADVSALVDAEEGAGSEVAA